MARQVGRVEFDDKLIRSAIYNRIFSPNRQNIGFILKDLGLPYYSEAFMLEKSPTVPFDTTRFVCYYKED